MTDIRISEVAARTGFGARYWQRRIAAGEVPGAKFVQAGARRIFVVDEAKFSAWWEQQKCPVTSKSAAAPGGIASQKTAKRTKEAYKPSTLDSLKSVLRE